jgi:hypothetical protein
VGSSHSRNIFKDSQSRIRREEGGGEPPADNRHQRDMLRPQRRAESSRTYADNSLRDVTRRQALDAQRQESIEDMNRVEACLRQDGDPDESRQVLSTLHGQEREELVATHELERDTHGDHPRLVERQQEAVAHMTARHRRQTALLDMMLRPPDRYSVVSGPPPSYRSRRASGQESSYSGRRLSGPPDESAEGR